MKRITEVVWGLNWKKHFPVQFGQYTVEISNASEFLALKKCPDSFLITSDNSSDNFIKDINSKTKEAYLNHQCDFFVINKKSETVGLFVCELRDWSSYYIRFMSIEKTHRNHQLSVHFFNFIEGILQEHGVDKMMIDVAPSNIKQVMRMSQLGFINTGNILSERFGACMQLTKFLKEENWNVFNQSFMQIFYSNKEREALMPSLEV